MKVKQTWLFLGLIASFNANAVWMTTGILDKKGKPAACLVTFDSKFVQTKITINKDLTPLSINFMPKFKKPDGSAVKFTGIQIDKKPVIDFAKADKKTPEKIITQFRKGFNAFIQTDIPKAEVPVNLTGFSRAINMCKPLMK